MNRINRLAAHAISLVLMVAGSADAQSSAASYVRSQVKDGQSVWVTPANGPTLQGRVAAISESQLEVSMLGRVTAFRWTDIRMIEVSDPLKNGIILGGIIGGLALAQVPSPRTGANVTAFAALGVGLGAAAGGYADYLREGRDMIYRNSSPTASIIPLLAPNAAGVSAVLRW